MSNRIYEEITQRIIEKLENGIVNEKFEMPFNLNNGIPRNRFTGKKYRGINAILLESGEYATFKQIKELGGKVRKNAKSEKIIFWKMIEVEDEETEEDIKVPLARIYNVFKIGRDTTGIELMQKEVKYHEHERIEKADEIIKNYKDKPKITYEQGRAYYSPSEDIVNVPKTKEFKDINRYYSTMFHELIHSTGAKNRLNRDSITKAIKFGSENYSKEELIAELGASMLCATVGIENKTIDYSASYINSWIKALKNDYTLIITASQNAQKACDYILNK